jgi:hypothetical protein
MAFAIFLWLLENRSIWERGQVSRMLLMGERSEYFFIKDASNHLRAQI